MSPVETDLTERVARAIFEADGTDSDWKWEPTRWERASYEEKERYRRLALAAIAALRGRLT